MSERDYTPQYRHSWALLIGIDDYEADLPPLNTAVKGVRELASTLQDELGFQAEHIITLENEQATQRTVRRAFTKPLSRPDMVGPDDRVIIYFAGHGVTFDTAEGEVGCIAPYDVEPGFIDSAVPMDELTRLANRMHAKHVLFLLDACFSGFATTREGAPGVERQVKDFLMRPARQVITAGTREQTVSDYWGPGGHSLFTGFLVDGLRGAAPAPGGVLRAFHLAGYLQDQVAQHSRSHQTPQYAALLGSQGGDFVFTVRESSELPPWLLELVRSEDATQRLIAVGQLNKLAQANHAQAQTSQALAQLQHLAEDDPDAMVRASGRAALRGLLPQTYITPLTRNELILTSVDLDLDVEEHEREAEVAAEPEPELHLVLTEESAEGTRFSVTEWPVTIGRTSDNSLPLKNGMASRHHAQIEKRDGEIWVTDLDSTNGTFVNDERVEGSRRLEDGDRIRIGQSVLEVSFTLPEGVPGYEAEAAPGRKARKPTAPLPPQFPEEQAADGQEAKPSGAAELAVRPSILERVLANRQLTIALAVAAALCLVVMCILVLSSSSY